MTRLSIPAAGAATLLLLGGSAWADVTPEEVWSEVRALMEGYGQTVTVGSEDRSGDTLTVSDIVIDFAMPETSSSAVLEQLQFVDRGDGTVGIVFPPEYRVISRSDPGVGEPFEFEMLMTHSAMDIVVSGDAAAKTYDFGADSIGLAITASDGNAEAPVKMALTMAAPSGAYVVRTEDGGRDFESNFDAASMQVDVAADDPATADTFTLKMDFQEVRSTSEGFLPNDVSMEDLPAALRAGMRAAGTIRYGATSTSFEGNMEGTQSQGTGTAQSGSFEFAFTPDGLVYGGTATGSEMRLRSSDIPLPELSMSVDQSEFRLAMPVTATEEPKDFALKTTLRGLTVSDSIWALFDPMAALPRDPATIAFDVTGQGRWFVDILDPEAAAQTSEAPGELNALTLNGLEVSVAGAELTGSGAFTFDNTDTTTFDGMPKPEGSVDLRLVGGNKLLDTLVGMGLVPEDQAMGARMMLGLFARPGEGEDTLVSTIEVNEAGEVLANGQRLR